MSTISPCLRSSAAPARWDRFTLSEATSLVGKAEETLENLDESLEGMNTMISDVDGVLVDNTEAMEEAIAKIGNIDVDSLNQSIQDLNKVVSSMGRLFGA